MLKHNRQTLRRVSRKPRDTGFLSTFFEFEKRRSYDTSQIFSCAGIHNSVYQYSPHLQSHHFYISLLDLPVSNVGNEQKGHLEVLIVTQEALLQLMQGIS